MRMTFSVALMTSKRFARARSMNAAAGTFSFSPSIKPSPRTSAITVRMFGEQHRQMLLQMAGHATYVVEEARRQHDVEHRVAHGHGQRIAAEGRTVGAGGHAFAAFSLARHAPIGKPPPMPLAMAMMSGVTPAC